MLTSTISWVLSALSYDEVNIVEYATTLFGKGFNADFQGTKNGSHFYGIVIDKKEGRAWIVNRGTDGYNKRGNLRSWVRYNANIFTGSDGVHNGFQRLGDRSFDNIKHYLWDINTVFCVGHSQGSAVAPYQACLCVENITSIKHVHFDLFANPPTGNKMFKRRVVKHFKGGKMSGDRYVNKDDIISSPLLRKKNSILLNGVDVGNEIKLPIFMRHKTLSTPFINHSCTTYNFLMFMLYAKMGYHHTEDYELLVKVHDLIVN